MKRKRTQSSESSTSHQDNNSKSKNSKNPLLFLKVKTHCKCELPENEKNAFEFCRPVSLCVSAKENLLYLTDSASCAIRKISTSTPTTTISKNSTNTSQPVQTIQQQSIATTFICWCDSENNEEFSVNSSLNENNSIGSQNQQQQKHDQESNCQHSTHSQPTTMPFGLALSPNEQHLYVSDQNENVIRAIDIQTKRIFMQIGLRGQTGYLDGNFNRSMFNLPSGLIVDKNERFLFVCDAGNNCIRKIDLKNYVVSTLCGNSNGMVIDGDKMKATFSQLNSITINNENNRLFVTDKLCLREIELDESMECKYVKTIAGNSEQEANYCDSVVGSEVRFSGLNSVVFDGFTKKLFVTDYLNHAIRSVDVKTGATETLISNSQPNDAFSFADIFKFLDGLAIHPTTGNLFVSDCFGHGGLIRVVQGAKLHGKFTSQFTIFKNLLRLCRLINGNHNIQRSRPKQLIFESIFRIISFPWFSLNLSNQICEISFSENAENFWKTKILNEKLLNVHSELNLNEAILKFQEQQQE